MNTYVCKVKMNNPLLARITWIISDLIFSLNTLDKSGIWSNVLRIYLAIQNLLANSRVHSEYQAYLTPQPENHKTVLGDFYVTCDILFLNRETIFSVNF